MSRIGKSTETEHRLVLATDWGRGTGSDCFMGTRVPFGVMKILELDGTGGTIL